MKALNNNKLFTFDRVSAASFFIGLIRSCIHYESTCTWKEILRDKEWQILTNIKCHVVDSELDPSLKGQQVAGPAGADASGHRGEDEGRSCTDGQWPVHSELLPQGTLLLLVLRQPLGSGGTPWDVRSWTSGHAPSPQVNEPGIPSPIFHLLRRTDTKCWINSAAILSAYLFLFSSYLNPVLPDTKRKHKHLDCRLVSQWNQLPKLSSTLLGL